MRPLRLTLPFLSILSAIAWPASAALVGERSPVAPGLWWDPQRSGTGFELHPAGSGLFAIWYTYRADGSAVWYTAQDDSIEDGTFDGALLRHRWRDGAHAGYTDVGRLELTISNPERIAVSWSLSGNSGEYAIEPFPTSGITPEVDHGGAWYETGRGGYGLTISEQGEVLVAALYAYDAAGEPVWYFGDNDRAGTRIQLDRFTATCAGCERPNPSARPAGALELEFAGESAMRARVVLATAELATEWRFGERPLVMLTRPASQRAADRQLAAFDDDELLGRYVREAMLNLRSSPYAGIDFSPPPAAAAFSQTNLQESGVDEAGAVRSDGALVYAFATGTGGYIEPAIRSVRVLDEGARIEVQPTIALSHGDEDDPLDVGVLYLTENRLVAITGTAPRFYVSMGLLPEPTAYRDGATWVEIFDRTGAGAPRSIWRARFDAHYTTSRRIGNSLYLVHRSTSFLEGMDVAATGSAASAQTRALVEAASLADLLPGVRIGDSERQRLVDANDVFLPPIGSRPPSPEFVSVVRIDLGTPAITAAIAISGTVDAHYVSPSRMYLATSRHDYVSDPVLGSIRPGFLGTDLHRIDLAEAGLVPSASGRVEGTVNRYSDRAAFRFSERGERLRLVTVSYNMWGEFGDNRLTILEPSTTAPGVLRTLAYLPNAQRPQPIGKRDELLYDTRFVEDRLYAVTFLKTDPLYVIDLSVPADPKIAGALEVPGFSDYLHPLPNDLLLGVGKGASPAVVMGDGQFAWYQGLQVSLFDVADAGRPRELQRVDLGKRGSETALLQHHHALSVRPTGSALELAIPMRLHEPDGTEPTVVPPSYTFPWARSGLFRFSLTGSSAADARLAVGAPLITYRRGGNPLPSYQDEAAHGSARSVLFPRGIVYVEGGRFWHLDTSSPGASHTGPM